MKNNKTIIITLILSIILSTSIVKADTLSMCNEVGVLKAIYFIKILVRASFILVPIGVIVIGLIDLSKSVIGNDEKNSKKNLDLFIKRLIYSIIFFCIPWLVTLIMNLLGDLTKDVEWIDCINNATSEKIKELEK